MTHSILVYRVQRRTLEVQKKWATKMLLLKVIIFIYCL
jgi:hypothetical protein